MGPEFVFKVALGALAPQEFLYELMTFAVRGRRSRLGGGTDAMRNLDVTPSFI